MKKRKERKIYKTSGRQKTLTYLTNKEYFKKSLTTKLFLKRKNTFAERRKTKKIRK